MRTAAKVVLDMVLVLAAFSLTQPFAGHAAIDHELPTHSIGALDRPAVAVALLAPLLILALGGYGRRPAGGVAQLTGRLIPAATVCVWAAWVVGASEGGVPSVGQFAAVWAFLPMAWLLARATGGSLARGAAERSVVIGTCAGTARVLDATRRHAGRRVELVGCLDDEALPLQGVPLLGGIDELPRIVAEHRIERVIVSFSTAGDEKIQDVLRMSHAMGLSVDVVPRFMDLAGSRARAHRLGGLSLVSVSGARSSSLGRGGKRTFDAVCAAFLLVLFAPVLAAIALAIKLDDGVPILFRQERIGRRGRVFKVVKFRTMRDGADGAGIAAAAASTDIAAAVESIKSQHGAYVTRVGGFLRRTSLDELPQLWNVLRGEMSMVGPRPLRPFEVESLLTWQRVRQDVRPGITGLWQVLGRSEIPWQERMELDYSYVRHWSLQDDLRILAQTVPAVLLRRGAV